MPTIWKRFRHGHPDYLARHYWWAYLWPTGLWIFDQSAVINAVLLGQYRRLMNETLTRFRHSAARRSLQLTSVYGGLTSQLAEQAGDNELHLMDTAMIQLQAARNKLRRHPQTRGAARLLARMNAESLAYADDSFDAIVIYFLLHELPPAVRRRVLAEVMRVLRPGGQLIIAEYGPRSACHLLHRFTPFRAVLERAEPFLAGFWQEDLNHVLADCAARHGKLLTAANERKVLAGFYRVASYTAQRVSMASGRRRAEIASAS